MNALEVLPQHLFAIGEFPVAGHGIDAEEVGGLDHVGALRRVGQAAALPQIAAVEQQRIAGAGVGAQPVNQRFQMGKAAHAAVTLRRLLKSRKVKACALAAAGRDAEMLEKRAADQMRRLAAHGADADIDARLTEIDRLQLGVRVGQMQDADIAEAADVVKIVVGRHAQRRGATPDAAATASQRKKFRRSNRVHAPRQPTSMDDACLPGGVSAPWPAQSTPSPAPRPVGLLDRGVEIAGGCRLLRRGQRLFRGGPLVLQRAGILLGG